MLRLEELNAAHIQPKLRRVFYASPMNREIQKLRRAGVSSNYFAEATSLYPACQRCFWENMTDDLIELYRHVPSASAAELKRFIWGISYFRNSLKIPESIPELLEGYAILLKAKKRRVDPYEIWMFAEAAKQYTKKDRGILKLAEQLVGYIEEGRPANNLTGTGTCWALIPAAGAEMGYFDRQ